MTRTNRNLTKTPARMIAGSLVAGMIGVASLFPVLSASAQSLWIDRDEVVAKLDGHYAESPTAMGLASNGGVVELFSAADGETWTLVLTMPDGRSTIVATGEGWIAAPVSTASRDS